jgi:cyclic pyranopterin phosphate synthase
MIDNFGRKINYLRLSATDLCNLRCKYCMPTEGITKKDCNNILRIEDFVKIAQTAVDLGIDKIRISGGEPLVRRGIIALIEQISAIDGVFDLAMTTNGILLPKYAKALKDAGLKRLNISLDSFNKEKYQDITRGGSLKNALKGIEAAKQAKFQKIKINVVLIKGFNDDEISDFVEFTRDNEIDVRFIEMMPFEGQRHFAEGSFIPAGEVLKRHPELVSVDAESKSSSAKYYRLPGALGKVGLIEPMSCKFCDNCNRIRVTADGRLLSCLHSADEVDLTSALGDAQQLKDLIAQSIVNKPEFHHLRDGIYRERDMGKIGG